MSYDAQMRCSLRSTRERTVHVETRFILGFVLFAKPPFCATVSRPCGGAVTRPRLPSHETADRDDFSVNYNATGGPTREVKCKNVKNRR
jgi:hypothetical protein